MAKLLQNNLQRKATALDLEKQTAEILVSVNHPRPPDTDRWISSINGTYTAALTDMVRIATESSSCDRGFTIVCLKDLVVYNCYYSLNCSVDEFSAYVDGLETDIRIHCPVNLVAASDFNAKSRSWSSALDNRRGTLLLEFTADHDL